MSWRTFFRLVQGCRIIDTLAALLAGKGIHHDVRGTHCSLFDCRGGLEGKQFLKQRFIQATTELGEQLG
jgi:hypothetical protein